MGAYHDVRARLLRGGDEIGGSVPRFTITSLVTEVAYGFTERASIGARAPFHWKRFEEPAAAVDLRRSGVGDIELFVTGDLLRSPEPRSSHWRCSATAGVALPTGAHEAQPFVGQAAPTPLQLGGGTFDPILGLSGAFLGWSGWQAEASLSARIAVEENDDRYRPPSLMEVAMGGAWRPGALALALHVEWSHLGRVEVDGAEVGNTGREALYLVPAVGYRARSNLDLGILARVPVYLRVNQTQLAETALIAARVALSR